MRTKLVEHLRQATPAVIDGEAVLVAYLFGSQATGRARPDSDIDVAVLLEENADPESFLDLRLRLASAFERTADVGPVEVVILNEAPLRLQGRVLSEGVLLYSLDEPLRVRYESLTRRQYFDFEEKAAALDRELLRAHAEGRR